VIPLRPRLLDGWGSTLPYRMAHSVRREARRPSAARLGIRH
jgi:hypothetical protein